MVMELFAMLVPSCGTNSQKDSASVDIFKSKLKTCLFNKAYGLNNMVYQQTAPFFLVCWQLLACTKSHNLPVKYYPSMLAEQTNSMEETCVHYDV